MENGQRMDAKKKQHILECDEAKKITQLIRQCYGAPNVLLATLYISILV